MYVFITMLTLLFRNYLYHRFKAIRYIQKSIHGKICNTTHIKPRLQYKLEGRMPEKKVSLSSILSFNKYPSSAPYLVRCQRHCYFQDTVCLFCGQCCTVPFQGILSHGIYCIYLLVFNEFLICNFAIQFLIVLMFNSYYIYTSLHHAMSQPSIFITLLQNS